MLAFIIASLATTLLVSFGNSQACEIGTAQEIKGNWYCSEVQAITYKNFPGNGSYNKVTDMNPNTGQCGTEKYDYSGSLAPLNEELSLHIRGPIWLKQVAVYKPGSTPVTKRSLKHGGHAHRHQNHQYLHHRQPQVQEIDEREIEKRSVGQLISATIDGQVVSWTNSYSGPGLASSSHSPAGAQSRETNVPASALSLHNIKPFKATSSSSTAINTSPAISKVSVSSAGQSPKPTSSTATGQGPVADHGWTRQAYYNAVSGTAKGFTFLNHYGGTDGIPGTAAGGSAFGASLSYASADGKSGAKSPQVLSNAMIDDDVEVAVMSNRSCDDGTCGFARPGGVNYHGFDGSEKVFLFEFSMPDTRQTGFNGNMPAIWVLNAQIPRTSQYGTNADCSCWTSGCGEFDLFEILDSGNFRCKSTLHMDPAGGSSDWFQRPTGASMTAALVIGGSSEVAAVRVLDQSQPFDELLSGDTVAKWLSVEGSVFKLSA